MTDGLSIVTTVEFRAPRLQEAGRQTTATATLATGRPGAEQATTAVDNYIHEMCCNPKWARGGCEWHRCYTVEEPWVAGGGAECLSKSPQHSGCLSRADARPQHVARVSAVSTANVIIEHYVTWCHWSLLLLCSWIKCCASVSPGGDGHACLQMFPASELEATGVSKC